MPRASCLVSLSLLCQRGPLKPSLFYESVFENEGLGLAGGYCEIETTGPFQHVLGSLGQVVPSEIRENSSPEISRLSDVDVLPRPVLETVDPGLFGCFPGAFQKWMRVAHRDIVPSLTQWPVASGQ